MACHSSKKISNEQIELLDLDVSQTTETYASPISAICQYVYLSGDKDCPYLMN
jgi:hypothetical protein